MQSLKYAVPLILIGLGTSCTHRVEVETKPIVVEVNINIKIDKELDDFFGDLDESLAEH